MSAKRSKKKTSKRSSTPDSTPKANAPRPDEMSADVIEFITAIDDYKREHSRPFPNWSEVLEILKGLGYERAEQS